MYTLEPRKDSEQQCCKCGKWHKYQDAEKIDLYLVNKVIENGKESTDNERKGMHIQAYAPVCPDCKTEDFNILMTSIYIGVTVGFVAFLVIKDKIGFFVGGLAGMAYYHMRPKFSNRSGKACDHPMIRKLNSYGFLEIDQARKANPRYHCDSKIAEILKTMVEKYDYVLKDDNSGIQYSAESFSRAGTVMSMAAWKLSDLAENLDFDMDLDADFDADFDCDFDGGD